MRHARSDYDQIQDPQGNIPDDEPVFLIRGQDKIGASAVRAWALLAEACGADPVIVATALDHAYRMEAWAKKHGKVPDMPTEQPDTTQGER